MKFYENPSSESRVAPYGRTDEWEERQTDRHDEANSRLSQFCELSSKATNPSVIKKYKTLIVGNNILFAICYNYQLTVT